MLAEGAAVWGVGESVAVEEGLEVGWGEYREIEAGLLELLNQIQFGLEDRLIALSAWLGMLAMFLRQARAESAAGDQEIVRLFRESMARGAWARPLRIARSAAPRPRVRRMFLCAVAAMRPLLGQSASNTRVLAAILGGYLRGAARIGQTCLLPLGSTAPIAALERVGFDPDMPEIEAMARHAIGHAIFRKDLLIRGDLIQGLFLLLAHYAMMRWHAQAIALRRGATRVAPQDFAQAIAGVESAYREESQMVRLLDAYPVLSSLAYSMSRRKNSAHALARTVS